MQVRVVPRLSSTRAGKVRIPLGSPIFSNHSADAVDARDLTDRPREAPIYGSMSQKTKLRRRVCPICFG
jgi:hypothetical protein